MLHKTILWSFLLWLVCQGNQAHAQKKTGQYLPVTREQLSADLAKRGITGEQVKRHLDTAFVLPVKQKQIPLKNTNSATTIENISAACGTQSPWDQYSTIGTPAGTNTPAIYNPLQYPGSNIIFFCNPSAVSWGSLLQNTGCAIQPSGSNPTVMGLAFDPLPYSGFSNGPKQGRLIRKTFRVDVANCIFYYQYAFLSGGCSSSFEVKVYNQNNSPVIFRSHNSFNCTTTQANCPALIAPVGATCLGLPPGPCSPNDPPQPPGQPDWCPARSICGFPRSLKAFSLESIDLSAYYNQDVTIEFSNKICGSGQHLMYTLVGGFCYCSNCNLSIDQTITEAKCGQPNGAIDISINGGTGLFTYQWSNGSTQQDISQLASGTYAVTVTDANGCTAEKTFQVNAQPSDLAITLGHSNEYCSNQNGFISITPSGGVAPYQIKWKKNGVVMAGQTGTSITGLGAGAYEAIVTDANGCENSDGETIQNIQSVIQFNGSISHLTCNTTQTGAISLANPGGGTGPYTYTWLFNGNQTSYNTSSITGIPAGQYQVTVKDSKGCSSSRTFTVGINPCPQNCCLGGKWTGREISWERSRLDKAEMMEEAILPPATEKKGPGNTAIGLEAASKISIKKCDSIYKLTQFSTYTFDAGYQCGIQTNGKPCLKQVSVKIKGVTDNSLDGIYPAPVTQTFPNPGDYLVTYYARCGLQICDSCTIRIRIEKDCCRDGRWKGAGYQAVNVNPNGSWRYEPVQILPLQINSPIPTYTAQVAINLVNLNYQCATGCASSYKLVKRNTVSGIETTLIIPAGQTSLSIYTEKDPLLIRLFPICGGKQCGNMLLFKVSCISNNCKTIISGGNGPTGLNPDVKDLKKSN